jgi:hypothetical protein
MLHELYNVVLIQKASPVSYLKQEFFEYWEAKEICSELPYLVLQYAS